MNEVKRVIIVNGSPKTTDVSVSGMLCSLLEKRFEPEHAHIIRINVRKNIDRDNTEDFSSMMNADAVVFVFPLYFFCLPGLVIRYLQDFYEFFGQHKKESDGIIKIYAVVNCGFPESDINSEALRVVKSFSMHINASFRFGISIGGGGMFLGAQNAPFMKRPMEKLDDAFTRIADDISGNGPPQDDVYINIRFPRFLYYLGGNMGWKQLSRKNGLKKKDLFRQPYSL